jgi:AcrR family transcriptional regulator
MGGTVPRIDAPTLAEHRRHVHADLVAATERIMRSGDLVTASAVSASAGIARNSIYRYVDSVDDLRVLVIDRYLPAWMTAVEQAMAAATTPGERVVAWVGTNLTQAHAAGHGWLMETMRSNPSSALAQEQVEKAHVAMRETLGAAWLELLGGDMQRTVIAASLTMGILEGGFRQLHAGSPDQLVIDLARRAAESLVQGLSADVAG